ncbi:hypothetical protein Pelo_6154 [Pelomyxa schiedti]|nr:hypothetical protein Pelo_6154 [Pelomyxa schiedti]
MERELSGLPPDIKALLMAAPFGRDARGAPRTTQPNRPRRGTRAEQSLDVLRETRQLALHVGFARRSLVCGGEGAARFVALHVADYEASLPHLAPSSPFSFVLPSSNIRNRGKIAQYFLFRSDENATELTSGLFMNRFVHWVVAVQQRRCLQALKRYYAPEIVAHKPYSNSIDIFAFGIMLAEMTPKLELMRTRVNDKGWEIHSLIAPSTPHCGIDI